MINNNDNDNESKIDFIAQFKYLFADLDNIRYTFLKKDHINWFSTEGQDMLIELKALLHKIEKKAQEVIKENAKLEATTNQE